MAHEFLQMLENEHEEVKGILEKLEKASSGATKTKESLFMTLKQELIPHMQGEEKFFYSALKEIDGAKEKAMEALEEHHVAEMVLKELDKLSMDADNWSAKLKVFKELVEHHIEEEEDEVFETAEESLDEKDLDEILASFQSEKEKAKKRIK